LVNGKKAVRFQHSDWDLAAYLLFHDFTDAANMLEKEKTRR
jgi:hypothetical protein